MVWLGLRILLASCPIELRGTYDSPTVEVTPMILVSFLSLKNFSI